ncbi:MAG TPA: hypothetical protein VGR77_06025 [Candidatus Dormibacteraeota bacterium]|nr:hypothetical protein [Candidatus Dormibacteraeota bacterium]
MPTNRIAFTKQLDILRAYAAASGPTGKTVRLREVAEIVKMNPDTITMANGFFAEVGFVQRIEGALLPAPEVMSYSQAHQWNADTAATKLAPLVRDSWFGKTLMPSLTFGGIEEKAALEKLALEAGASPEYKGQVSMLLDYLQVAGVIVKDGNMVKLNRGNAAVAPSAEERAGPGIGAEIREIPKAQAVHTTFAQAGAGAVQFQVSFKVDMAEVSSWAPERITAFFAGIAQVLAAKGSIEKEAAGG